MYYNNVSSFPTIAPFGRSSNAPIHMDIENNPPTLHKEKLLRLVSIDNQIITKECSATHIEYLI
jgi:hypothetical protein